MMKLFSRFAIAIILIAGVGAAFLQVAPGTRPALASPESDFVNILNDYRAQNGLGPVTVDGDLTNAAAWMSNDMATHHYLRHEPDSMGRSFGARIAAFNGSRFWTYGENIAWGYESAQAVFEGWRNSPGHNANMLNGDYNLVGVARTFGPCPDQSINCPSGASGWYWVAIFGAGSGAAPVEGDADCSGERTVFDAVLILRSVAGAASLPCSQAGDLNGDGSVNVADAVLVKMRLAGVA